jgi:hypothetical protein
MGVCGGHEDWLVKTNSLLWTQTQRFLLKSLVVYDIGLGRDILDDFFKQNFVEEVCHFYI